VRDDHPAAWIALVVVVVAYAALVVAGLAIFAEGSPL